MYSANLLINSEIRKEARGKLKGNWLAPVGAYTTYFAIMILLSFSDHFISYIATVIFDAGMLLGFTIMFLNLIRTNQSNYNDLFKGFKNLWKAIGAYLLTLLLILLWSLLLIIPGIIAAIRYSQTLYIIADNPNIKVIDAIKESKRMMNGSKMRYFKLSISFIGWLLLSILTLGIGLLWLLPYINTSLTIFYEDLKGREANIEVNKTNDVDSPIQEL